MRRNEEIGKICKQARKICGVSVTEFAITYCNCSMESVYKFEQGKLYSLSLFLQYFRFFSDEDIDKLKNLDNMENMHKNQ